jgi:hypothetical protein
MVTQVERRVRTHSWGKNSEEHEELVAQAGRILRRNDMGGWTRAAPWLYPHQWSWDSAFIAIGLAHLDTLRSPVENWQGTSHRVQPEGSASQLLSRCGSLVVRRGFP